MKLTDQRIVVTGGTGFLGSHLVERLLSAGCKQVFGFGSRECDLTRADDVQRMYRELRPDVVFHLAARVGGIGANELHPGLYFHDNLMMGVNVIEQARRSAIGRIVLVGTICSYPKLAPIPFREAELWNGYPEETNAPYGIAKKALLTMADAYRRQYGLDTVCLLPVNLYGPRDNFDLQTSHVIPAMLRKFAQAQASGERQVVLWGDGSPTREFLFVDDCVDALIMAAEKLEGSEPVNIGTGREISMRELAQLISSLCGFEGEIRWDATRPNGQPRRRLDTSMAAAKFGFEARTSLREGLLRTLEWHQRQQAASAPR